MSPAQNSRAPFWYILGPLLSNRRKKSCSSQHVLALKCVCGRFPVMVHCCLMSDSKGWFVRAVGAYMVLYKGINSVCVSALTIRTRRQKFHTAGQNDCIIIMTILVCWHVFLFWQAKWTLEHLIHQHDKSYQNIRDHRWENSIWHAQFSLIMSNQTSSSKEGFLTYGKLKHLWGALISSKFMDGWMNEQKKQLEKKHLLTSWAVLEV